MLGIICILIFLCGLVLVIEGFHLEAKAFVIGGIISALFGIVCFFAVPVVGYMKVDSTHWFWSVDIYEFKPCEHSGSTYHCDTEYRAEKLAKESIPNEAYNINIEIIRKKETTVESEWVDENGFSHELKRTDWYYYGEYSYTINEWTHSGEVTAVGNNKEPYEPARPYDTTAPDIIGERKCGEGHHEAYTVTGVVDDKIHTYSLSKEDWERINTGDEFEYEKFRFGEKIWGLNIAQ